MKGTTVQLVVNTIISNDPFGAPIEQETLVDVPDVLVGQPSESEITGAMERYGKKVSYTLGIPKGDTHTWYDTDVYIWGDKYRTVGYPVTGEADNIPLRWGKNVLVERYG